MECQLVWLDSMNQDHLDLRFRVLRIGMPRGTEHYPKVDNDPRTKFLCAYINQEMVGCSTLQVDSRNGCKYRIRGMAVDSEYRNKGIGSKIVNELQRIAEEEKQGYGAMLESKQYRCMQDAAFELFLIFLKLKI